MAENEITKEQPAAQTVEVNETPKADVSIDAGKAQAQAFYTMRKQNKQLKEKLKALEEKVNTPVEVAEVPKVAPSVQEVNSIEDLNVQADSILLSDPEVLKNPGIVFSIMDSIENDPYLARIDKADPLMARKMALEKWKSVNTATPVADPVKPTANANRGTFNNIEALVSKLDTLKPGTVEYKNVLAEIISKR